MALLEICCYSMECALTAQQNGADRVELCAAPKEGGLTPSLGVLKSVRQRVTIPVHPIIRPRGGDFCYSDGEFAAILEDVRTVRELGFPGLVTGVLDVDGNVDMPRMEKIMAAAGPLAVTFHRAFDMCANPLNTLNNLAELGITRVLTSGQKSDALQGLSKIMELIAHRDAPIIMAGAGVRAENLHHFLDAGVLEVHAPAIMIGASRWAISSIIFDKPCSASDFCPDVSTRAMPNSARLLSVFKGLAHISKAR